MELKYLKVGRLYKAKDGSGKLVTARLEKIVYQSVIVDLQENQDAPNLRIIQYDFITLITHRRFSVRSLASIKEEVRLPIVKGALVKIIKGGDKEALERTYLVEDIISDYRGMIAKISVGKHWLYLPIGNLRHIDDEDPPRCYYPNCEHPVTQLHDSKECCTKHFKILTEVEV